MDFTKRDWLTRFHLGTTDDGLPVITDDNDWTGRGIPVANPDDAPQSDIPMGKHLYLISMANCTQWECAVFADWLGEAFDIAADYAQEQGWVGLFHTYEEARELEAEGHELSFAGNESWPITDEWYGTVLCDHIN